jgi:hypothetical protein
MERPENLMHPDRSKASHPHKGRPLDVVRQLSEALNRESLIQSTQEHTQILAQGEQMTHQTTEPSLSTRDTHLSEIQSQAQMFVQAVQEDTRIQGVKLTNEEYQKVKKHLEQMKLERQIDDYTYIKAREKAYNRSTKRIEIKHNYEKTDDGKKRKKVYQASEKGRKVGIAYNRSDKGRKARKSYETSDIGRKARKSYETSDIGIERTKRHINKLKNPFLNQERLLKKIQKDEENYRRAVNQFEQQILQHLSAFPQAEPEVHHLLQKRQELQEQWNERQARNHDALRKADVLVKVYTQVCALVDASQSASHQQKLGQTQHQHVGEEPNHDPFQNSEHFLAIYKHFQALLKTVPSVSPQQELAPTDPSAAQPSSFERLVSSYEKLDGQLEVFLAGFADPESLQQANTLDF